MLQSMYITDHGKSPTFKHSHKRTYNKGHWPESIKLPATGMYPGITKLIFDEWQEVWNCCAGNKLHAIRPTVGYYQQKTCLSESMSTAMMSRGAPVRTLVSLP